MRDPDWWTVLGVPRDAPVEDVRIAYDARMNGWRSRVRERIRQEAGEFYTIKTAWECFSRERNHGLPPDQRWDPVLGKVIQIRSARR